MLRNATVRWLRCGIPWPRTGRKRVNSMWSPLLPDNGRWIERLRMLGQEDMMVHMDSLSEQLLINKCCTTGPTD